MAQFALELLGEAGHLVARGDLPAEEEGLDGGDVGDPHVPKVDRAEGTKAVGDKEVQRPEGLIPVDEAKVLLHV